MTVTNINHLHEGLHVAWGVAVTHVSGSTFQTPSVYLTGKLFVLWNRLIFPGSETYITQTTSNQFAFSTAFLSAFTGGAAIDTALDSVRAFYVISE